MIEVKIKNTCVRLSFTFFAVTALFLLTNSGFGFAALCACGLHELCHLIMMIVFGIKADEILFYGAGICISSREISRAEAIPRIIILSAGCIGNLFAALLLNCTGNTVAAAINLFTALFNILPIGSLDGAQILKFIAVSCCKPENVDKIMRFAGIISAIILASVIFCSGGISFSLGAIILYIVIISCLKV